MSNTAGRGRGPMGRRRGMSGEKAKDFKGAMLRLLKYMERYKIRLILMVIFAIGGTVFNIIGPKILGKATTELYSGLISKINGGSGIDFDKIIKILVGVMCLYVVSSVLSFIQGFIMTGISNDVTYNLRKDISKKINKIPMKYFESRTHGEILSRITNEVDTPPRGWPWPFAPWRPEWRRCPRRAWTGPRPAPGPACAAGSRRWGGSC